MNQVQLLTICNIKQSLFLDFKLSLRSKKRFSREHALLQFVVYQFTYKHCKHQ